MGSPKMETTAATSSTIIDALTLGGDNSVQILDLDLPKKTDEYDQILSLTFILMIVGFLVTGILLVAYSYEVIVQKRKSVIQKVLDKKLDKKLVQLMQFSFVDGLVLKYCDIESDS